MDRLKRGNLLLQHSHRCNTKVSTVVYARLRQAKCVLCCAWCSRKLLHAQALQEFSLFTFEASLAFREEVFS